MGKNSTQINADEADSPAGEQVFTDPENKINIFLSRMKFNKARVLKSPLSRGVSASRRRRCVITCRMNLHLPAKFGWQRIYPA